MKAALLSGATAAALFAAARAGQISAGDGIEIASRGDDGTFLRARRASGINGACGYYEDFWPTYYQDPTLGRWKRYCKRALRFTFAQGTNTISNLEAFQWNGDPIDDELGDPVPGFWFVPAGSAVPELFDYFVPYGVPLPPAGATVQVRIYLVMFREVVINPPENRPPRRSPVDPNENSSIPFVSGICWSHL